MMDSRVILLLMLLLVVTILTAREENLRSKERKNIRFKTTCEKCRKEIEFTVGQMFRR